MTNTIKEAVNKIAIVVGTINLIGHTALLEQEFESNLALIMQETGLCRDKATDYAIQIATRLNEEKVMV